MPESRADPRSRLIAVPVTLWGGPGLNTMDWPQASRFTADHDLVLVGYRGVDGSVWLDCPEELSATGVGLTLVPSSSGGSARRPRHPTRRKGSNASRLDSPHPRVVEA